MDDNGHGTHVSGTIGATGGSGAGVVGVSWIASVMGLKFLDARGSGTTADAINAIEFAIQARQALGLAANVRVLSNSWGGGGFSQLLLDEINKANASDMVFVAAAGNAGSNNDKTANYPSNYAAPNVVAVAATDSNDRLASFSNYGATTVDLGAPGVNVLSTYPGNRYAYMSGTSMATPHVSGAAALVLAACDTGTAALINALLGGVDKIPALAGMTLTGGRLNVNNAISVCQGTPLPQPTADFTLAATPSVATVKRGGSTTYTVTIASAAGDTFSGDVSLRVSGLPSGARASFTQATVAGTGTSSLTVTTSKSTSPKSYTLTITGTSGSLAHSTTVSLSVTR
jgi:subtilisin family serine protease